MRGAATGALEPSRGWVRKLGLFAIFGPADLSPADLTVPASQDQPGVAVRGVPEWGRGLLAILEAAPKVLGADAAEKVDFLNHPFRGHAANPRLRTLNVRHAAMKSLSLTFSGRHALIQLNNY